MHTGHVPSKVLMGSSGSHNFMAQVHVVEELLPTLENRTSATAPKCPPAFCEELTAAELHDHLGKAPQTQTKLRKP